MYRIVAGRVKRPQSSDVKYAFFAVDRIEGALAVLVGDDGRTAEFPVLELPTPLRRGTVLRVRYGAGNMPDWSSAVIDPKERKRRLRPRK